MTSAIVGSVRAPGILDWRPAVVPSAVSSNPAETEFLRVLARNRALFGPRLDFHYVPGRLRLRAAELKTDPAKLEAFCAELGAVPGVRSVTPHRLSTAVAVVSELMPL